MATSVKYVEFTSIYNGKKRIAKAGEGVHSVFSVLVSNGKVKNALKIFANRHAWKRYKRANSGSFISRIDYNGSVNETKKTRTNLIVIE